MLQVDLSSVPLSGVEKTELEREMAVLLEGGLSWVNLKAPEQYEKALKKASSFEEELRELV